MRATIAKNIEVGVDLSDEVLDVQKLSEKAIKKYFQRTKFKVDFITRNAEICVFDADNSEDVINFNLVKLLKETVREFSPELCDGEKEMKVIEELEKAIQDLKRKVKICALQNREIKW